MQKSKGLVRPFLCGLSLSGLIYRITKQSKPLSNELTFKHKII
nr:MAG TPA: hypothetical protein [Caudoviricetes sp.]